MTKNQVTEQKQETPEDLALPDDIAEEVRGGASVTNAPREAGKKTPSA